MAVPPMFRQRISSMARSKRAMSRRMASLYARNSWPRRDGHSILHLCAAHLDHVVKLLRLLQKSGVQTPSWI